MDIVKLIHRALSDEDIRRILGGRCKILKYGELSKFGELDDLLPDLLDYAIVLYEEKENSGHWVGLLKYNNLFEFFDSYGLIPDKELSWVGLKTRRTLNEATPYLSIPLKKEHYVYNHVKYQDLDNYVNTCGSHVCHRIYRLIHDNVDQVAYHKYMKGTREDTNSNFDVTVTIVVKSKLKED
jgi:hypothetical protein